MRPQQLICISALFCRGLPQANRRAGQHTCDDKHSFAAALLCGLFVAEPHDIGCVGVKSSKQRMSTMSDTSFNYLQHGMEKLKDLGSAVEDRVMDVIVAGVRKDAKEHVIFFGGDVQDYPEEMQSHRDNGKYVHWNSLATAGRLCERFPGAMVLVIKPHHMHLKTFSVYSQFVQCNDFGVPHHSPDHGAWNTLVRVYTQAVCTATRESSTVGQNAQEDDESSPGCGASESSSSINHTTLAAVQQDAQKGESAAPIDSCSVATLPHTPVHLIGFSKGCIVLNQLLHELKAVENNKEVQEFTSRLRTITWLDGGHSGGSNTWVTDREVLQMLANLKIDIHVHVTPYQVQDDMRHWIGKEKRRFVEILRKAGAKITDTLHFDAEPKSIENHFRVLEVF